MNEFCPTSRSTMRVFRFRMSVESSWQASATKVLAALSKVKELMPP